MAQLPGEHVVQVRAELGNAVTVRPGDKLVYATPATLSRQEAGTVKARFAELLPGVEVVIADQCSGLAVYRDEARIIHLDEPLSAENLDRIRAGLHKTLPGE